jgi:two-component system cell cycle sensor histidine kinase/response regulator CckA
VKRVLAVDDHAANLYLLQVLMQSAGYEVEQAANGAEALEKARQNPPDLVISDILMPIVDGFTLCRAWKADQKLSHIPFIFYTATYTDRRDRDLAFNMGADAFITKPADPVDFLAAVLSVMSKADAARPNPPSRRVGEQNQENVLKQYNDALVRKLEKKMLQLDKSNRDLEHEASERKRAEESLRLVRFSLDHVADSVFWTDPAGRIIFAGAAASRSLGYEPDELLRLTVFDLDPKVTPARWDESWKRLKEGRTRSFETEHRTKTGFLIPVDVSVNYVAFEHKEYNCVFARDITERIRTENVLRRQLALDEILEDLLSQLVSASGTELDRVIDAALQPIAQFIGVDGAILFQAAEDLSAWTATYGWTAPFIQSPCERLQGIPRGTLTAVGGELSAGRTIVVHSSSDISSNAVELRELWNREGVRSALLVPFRGHGGSVRGFLGLFAVSSELALEYQLVRQAEQVAKAFATALERKYVEESLRESDERLRQSQKMEALGQLAGGIAHDFNNMLTAIIGYSDLLLTAPDEEPNPPDVNQSVGEIRKAALRAAELTGQILAFSRRQALRPQVISINEMIEEVRPLLQRTLSEHLELSFLLDPQAGKCDVDPHQMVSVLMNLAVNARDAMPHGGKLTVESANVELDEGYCARVDGLRPGGYVVLTVRDTGIGMDKQTLSRIFEPFYTTKDPGHGTGLGLSTVHGIVTQSGGGISVDSEPGKGSTFRIYLPRSDKTATATKARPTQPTGSAPGPGGETILVVEDEEAVRFLLTRALRAAGYDVLAASVAPEALEILRQGRKIDLLLTDMSLPGDTQGDALSRQAQDYLPGLAVLQISGYSQPALAHSDDTAEDIGFLEKPFTSTALKRKVREALDARRAL